MVIHQKYANCHSVSVPLGGDQPDDSPHLPLHGCDSLTNNLDLHIRKAWGPREAPLMPKKRLTSSISTSNTGNTVFPRVRLLIFSRAFKRYGRLKSRGSTSYRARECQPLPPPN